jgi:hypothetical protein
MGVSCMSRGRTGPSEQGANLTSSADGGEYKPNGDYNETKSKHLHFISLKPPQYPRIIGDRVAATCGSLKSGQGSQPKCPHSS